MLFFVSWDVQRLFFWGRFSLLTVMLSLAKLKSCFLIIALVIHKTESPDNFSDADFAKLPCGGRSFRKFCSATDRWFDIFIYFISKHPQNE